MPWMRVAATTAPTNGASRSARRCPITSSIRNLVDAGRTRPQMRLIVMSTSPAASSPRRGPTSSLSSGHNARSRSERGGLGSADWRLPEVTMTLRVGSVQEPAPRRSAGVDDRDRLAGCDEEHARGEAGRLAPDQYVLHGTPGDGHARLG